jgi:hypothetical protein
LATFLLELEDSEYKYVIIRKRSNFLYLQNYAEQYSSGDNMNNNAFWAGVLLSAIFASQTVSAASVTQCGATICYTYDDEQAAVDLYGTPTLLGDALRFLPTDFRAQSDDGAGLVSTSASFFFDNVYSMNGDAIEKIMINEFGDYEITNGDRVSDELTLSAVNNLVGGGSASEGEIFNATGGTTGLQEWEIDNTLDVSSQFLSNSLNLTVTNVLEAVTDASGESAWIQKKLKIQAVTTTAVPLPAGAWLMMSAIGVLGGLVRRKKA